MLAYIDSKALTFFQKFSNFMEEWFDWWDRFSVAEFFGVLFLLSYQLSNLLSTLSEQDRRWGGFLFLSVMAIGGWLLFMKYLSHRKKVSLEEESSEAIRLYEIDSYANSNRLWMLFWLLLEPILCLLFDSTIERREGYGRMFSVSIYAREAAWLSIYGALCMAALRNGKRKQRMKNLVKKPVGKLSESIPSPTPVPSAVRA